jgi:hypothetical protein
MRADQKQRRDGQRGRSATTNDVGQLAGGQHHPAWQLAGAADAGAGKHRAERLLVAELASVAGEVPSGVDGELAAMAGLP